MAKDKYGFKQWAATYDKDVFEKSDTDDWMFGGYERVLEKVVEYSEIEKNYYSSVLEIGVGTGNLASRFLERGMKVTGLDPIAKMRKICRRKYPAIKVFAGDFINYPRLLHPVDIVASAYAWHHLNDTEKIRSIPLIKSLLKPGGRIVIADFVFQNTATVASVVRSIRDRSGSDYYSAFEGEYPGFFEELKLDFAKEGFRVDGEQLTFTVWVIRACL